MASRTFGTPMSMGGRRQVAPSMFSQGTGAPFPQWTCMRSRVGCGHYELVNEQSPRLRGNACMRKHLGLPSAPRLAETAATPPESLPPLIMTARPGALLPLVATGRLAAGETLTWHRPRCRQTHIVTVDGAGRLITADGAVFYTPDSCATALAGYPCKGWPYWQTATGATLQQLREQEAVPLQQDTAPDESSTDATT
jgi:hypothetical protein